MDSCYEKRRALQQLLLLSNEKENGALTLVFVSTKRKSRAQRNAESQRRRRLRLHHSVALWPEPVGATAPSEAVLDRRSAHYVTMLRMKTKEGKIAYYELPSFYAQILNTPIYAALHGVKRHIVHK